MNIIGRSAEALLTKSLVYSTAVFGFSVTRETRGGNEEGESIDRTRLTGCQASIRATYSGTLSLTRSGHAARRDNLCTSKVLKEFGSTMSFMERDDDNFEDRI